MFCLTGDKSLAIHKVHNAKNSIPCIKIYCFVLFADVKKEVPLNPKKEEVV